MKARGDCGSGNMYYFSFFFSVMLETASSSGSSMWLNLDVLEDHCPQKTTSVHNIRCVAVHGVLCSFFFLACVPFSYLVCWYTYYVVGWTYVQPRHVWILASLCPVVQLAWMAPNMQSRTPTDFEEKDGLLNILALSVPLQQNIWNGGGAYGLW